MFEILLAILAGILTIGAPCILPMLPILLGASVGQQNKFRPLFIALGFITTFSLVGISLSFIITKFELSPDFLRRWAIYALLIFGVILIREPFTKILKNKTNSQQKSFLDIIIIGLLLPFWFLDVVLTFFEQKFNPTINKANEFANHSGAGNFGAFILGTVLGLIWTPCAGPVLGSILTLIATQTDILKASFLLFAYALGAGIPLLIIGYGSQYITTKVKFIANYANTLQKIFGIIIIALAVAMYFNYDLVIQAKLIEFYPGFLPKI